MIVVATTVDSAGAVSEHVASAGVADVHVVALDSRRRLVLGGVADAWDAERIVGVLRGDGLIAVNRPDGGPRLERWMDETRPVTFGDRLSVCAAWSEHDRAGLPGLVELGLGGFGNGSHPTTRLLIEELLERVRGGDRVLDVGCGSGVLGLCALRLGAAEVIAVDVKPEAVEASRRNAAINGLDGQLTATTAPLGEIDGSFDVVLANVARAATVELAPELVRCVAPGGWLAVSGISPSQCDQVAPFLRPLAATARRDHGEWSVLLLAPS